MRSPLLLPILIVSGLGFAQDTRTRGVWPDDMREAALKGTSAAKRGEANLKLPGTSRTPSWSSRDPVKLTPAQIHALESKGSRISDVLRQAKSMMARQEYGTAEQLLTRELQMNADESSLAVPLSDIYFRSNRQDLAYQLLATYVDRNAMPELNLRASVAASLRGEVYKGQSEYCIQHILEYNSGRPETIKYIPRANSERGLLIQSYMAVAQVADSQCDYDNALFYGRLVLNLAPGNPVASLIVADALRNSKRYAEAVKVLERSLPSCQGSYSKAVRLELNDLRYLSRIRPSKG